MTQKKQSLTKKSRLDGEAETLHSDDPRYTKSKSLVVPEKEAFVVENPFTGKKTELVLDRNASTEQKLGALLLSSDATQDQKEMALSNLLLVMGKESSSFLAELYRYKGSHTKETRVFKTQMRFDFESFVNKFSASLDAKANGVFELLELPIDFYDQVVAMIKKNRLSINLVIRELCPNLSLEAKVHVYNAIRDRETSESLINSVKQITEQRLKDQGYGVYISSKGEIYSIFDKELDAQIEVDKENASKEKVD